MIVAQFGALPSGLVQPERGGGIQEVRANRIPSGPHVVAGPFTFPVNVNEYSFKATYNKLVSTAEGRDLMQDILQEVNKLSKKTLLVLHNAYLATGASILELDGAKCLSAARTKLIPAVPSCADRKKEDGRVWRKIRIPDDHLWDYRYLTDEADLGPWHQLPVYRFTHPVKNESWGVYVNIDNYGNYKFTVKKVVKHPSWLSSLWSTVWGAIKELVAKVVQFLGEIYDILKAAACSMAKPYLTDLQKIADQDYKDMDLVATNAKFGQLGVSPEQLSLLASGDIRVQAAMAIGQEVAARLCKPTGGSGGSGFPWSSYPKGSVARFNLTRKVWAVYAPTTTAGLGDAYASSAGLGGDPVDPPIPTGTTKVGEEPETAPEPTGNVKKGGTETDKPVYKRAWFWALIIGGGAATAGGIYWWRKRKTRPQLKSAWM